MSEFRRICVVGLGYIGLPTATLFADAGIEVFGVDVNPDIVDATNSGRAHFGEPNLDRLLKDVVDNGKLKAGLKPQPADAFIIAVPTPFLEGHQPDLRYVEAATRAIAPLIAKGNLIILESTSPVGTTEQIAAWLAAIRPDLNVADGTKGDPDIYLAYCPERVLPGRILEELVDNARTLGGLTPVCGEKARSLYQTVVKGQCSVTTARTAEMAKLSENAFRDVNIAFANELSMICDKLDVDVWELIRIANLHPRVNILEPGPGVGGHCIAVDPWFIVSTSPDQARLVRRAREVNDSKPHYVVDKVLRAAARTGGRPVIACFGLTYKPNVDDMRESPSIEIAQMLSRADVGDVVVVEPHISVLPSDLAGPGIELADVDQAIARADILVLLVDHSDFRGLDRARLSGKTVIDTRGIWSAR